MEAVTVFDNLLTALKAEWHGLPDKPDETPLSTLRALWYFVVGLSLDGEDDVAEWPVLSADAVGRLRQLVAQRISGVPLAYLTGSQTYMGLALKSSPAAMIPRKETELLGYAALERARELAAVRGNIYGLDLCTGSGNVVLALAHFLPAYQGMASDISSESVQLATDNARSLGLDTRVTFQVGDLFQPFSSPQYAQVFDLITCNPPYIATANTEKMAAEIALFEPRAAFDGGAFGVNLIMRLVREAPAFLKPASWLMLEVGLGQGEAVVRLFEKTGQYQVVGNCKDPDENIRVVFGQVP